MENMEPGIIRKLDEVVVNRIAAGEIIQRPANAIKELLENCLDAKSTFIQVTVKAGGLKLIQIQDNGTGIRKEDLAIVCERFTTSKLSKFEDLTSIATYGFRGEALSSISHVAHLSIQTKTCKEQCGYKASYQDGKLKAPAKPCASNQGTIITIEDLFYNMPQRKQALKSPSEEFQKISDVMSKYAVHNPKTGFLLKKHGEHPSLKTTANSSHELNIQTIFGANIAKELMAVELKDDIHKFSMKGFITKVNYSAKKGIMLLFINHRLVDCAGVRGAIDGVYSTYLPKGMHPFVYLSLELEPSSVDINVHPTKHEVHFLYQDEIIDKIKAQLEAELLGSNSTRTFYKQLKITEIKDSVETNQSFKNALGEKVQAKDMVRTDNKEQKLDKFVYVGSVPKSDFASSLSCSGSFLNEESFREIAAKKSKEVRLTSVLEMQKRIEKACSVSLRKVIKEMVFVGVVDKHFALFQHETKLYMANTLKLSEELFYQRLVYEFQNLPHIRITPSKLSIREMIVLALNSSESGWTEEDGDKEELAKTAAEILTDKSGIMREYFSLHITPEGELEILPSLLQRHCPSKTFLPLYMLRLATEVEWDTEEECFETFCRETARYYASVSEAELQSNPKRHQWQVEHVLYPSFKKYLLPDDQLKKQFYELADLPALYKVFERC